MSTRRSFAWPTRPTTRRSTPRPTNSTSWAAASWCATSTMQNRGRFTLLDMIAERLPKLDVDSPEDTARAGDEGGHRRPPQRRQEHVRQHAGPGRADDRQRSAGHDARQRRRAVRAGRQGVHGDRHARPAAHARALPPTSIFTAPIGPSGASAGPTWCFMFFDPTQRISKVDKQLCEYVAEQYKPCVFVVNKWDLVADSMLTEKWVSYLHDTFRTMRYVPIAFITGQTGKNVKALLEPRPDAVQAGAAAGGHGRSEPRGARGAGAKSAAAAPEPSAQSLLRHAGQRASRRRSCCFATIR